MIPIEIKPDVVLENVNTGGRVRIAAVDLPLDCVSVYWGDTTDTTPSIPIRRDLFTDPYMWKVIEPYVCGTCHHRFYEGTPAGRCPREADHPDDDDDEQSADPTWNVYSIWEGAVDDEESFDDLADAALKFAEMVTQYEGIAERGELTGDVTVHLYHPGFGTMEAERHISQHA